MLDRPTPPRRLLLGEPAADVAPTTHQARLQGWAEWDAVARGADCSPSSSSDGLRDVPCRQRPAPALPSLVRVSSPGLVLLSVLVAAGGGVLGAYCLSSVLVMGGRSAQWLEANRWVYAAAFAVGCTALVVGIAVPLWPLAPLGAALAFVATGRYLWLNV